MILNINEVICKETVDKISTALNNLKPNEKLFLYFSSEGGETYSAEAIIHIINNNIDLIELVGYGDLMSAGFDIFFKSNCYRILLPNSLGMFHQTTVNIDINESANASDRRGQADKTWMKLQKEQTIKFCESLKMTDKEISEIKKGRDVYFQHNRMLDFLNIQQN